MLNNTITIQNPAGQEVASFPILRGQSIADAADRAGHAIPTACCAGACNVCMCRVISGGEYVDIGLKQVPMIDVESDEVLTCVGGVYDSIFDSASFVNIVLQRLH